MKTTTLQQMKILIFPPQLAQAHLSHPRLLPHLHLRRLHLLLSRQIDNHQIQHILLHQLPLLLPRLPLLFPTRCNARLDPFLASPRSPLSLRWDLAAGDQREPRAPESGMVGIADAGPEVGLGQVEALVGVLVQLVSGLLVGREGESGGGKVHT